VVLKALLLADIHSNLAALEAIFADCGAFDQIWCMGDVVGYGPDPVLTLELLRSHDFRCVSGNHDAAVSGVLSVDDFNDAAAWAARWTTSQLSPEDLQYLKSLPLSLEEGPFTLVHGSLRAPLWEYLVSVESAMASLALMQTTYCLVGHSHLPFICREESGGVPTFTEFPERQPVPMGQERWVINPGGVGQPRDGDPRSSYALYDSDEGVIERRRVVYDIAKTQRKMEMAGLPEPLIHRLNFGR
jgi:diadenosine tetraphosphatase ApaH/serine/threonine PP2A family protein phosphatase